MWGIGPAQGNGKNLRERPCGGSTRGRSGVAKSPPSGRKTTAGSSSLPAVCVLWAPPRGRVTFSESYFRCGAVTADAYGTCGVALSYPDRAAIAILIERQNQKNLLVNHNCHVRISWITRPCGDQWITRPRLSVFLSHSSTWSLNKFHAANVFPIPLSLLSERY